MGYIITNVNEEDETYQERYVDAENVSEALFAALRTLDQFPNDSIVITIG